MDVLRRLGELIQRRHVDAVALTSAATTEYLLSQAEADGVLDEVVHALATDVAAVCLGPLTARPLRDHGVPAIVAATPTILDLAAVVASDLPARAVVLRVGGHSVEVRSQAVVVGGQVVAIAPGPLAVLRALALSPGRVLSAAEIRHVWKTGSRVDDHAVEMAVSRLRKCLDGTALEGVELVQTVMKRGYRVAG
jgi:uroporphyrinogen-III synthase